MVLQTSGHDRISPLPPAIKISVVYFAICERPALPPSQL